MTGSLTVVFAGAVAGAVAALLFLAVARRLSPGAPALWRGLVVGLLTLMVATPGIRPPRPLTFALFAPAFVAYGIVLVWWWRRAVDRTIA